MFGDRLNIGKKSFIPSRQPTNTQSSDSADFIHIDALASSTPARQQYASSIPTSAQTPLQEIAGEEEVNAQSGTKRRNASERRESARKRKVTGVSVMQDISAGLQAVTDAMQRNTTITSQAKEDVDATLEKQAQLQVQEEDSRLTDDRMMVMVDIHADVAMARTCLVFRKPAMRKAWIRLQLHKYAEVHTGIFSNWFIECAEKEF